MPQISVWTPTRNLVRRVADRMSTLLKRPVKQNEVMNDALMRYAKENAQMDDASIKEALDTPEPARAKRS